MQSSHGLRTGCAAPDAPTLAWAPPVTTVVGVPDGWTRDDVTFLLSIDTSFRTFNISMQTFYAFDVDTPWLMYGGPLTPTAMDPYVLLTNSWTVSTEGATLFRCFSKDSQGDQVPAQREPDVYTWIKIDKSPPVSTISGLPSGWTGPGTYSFSLDAADVYSGVKTTFYSIGGGPAVAYAGGTVPVFASSMTSVDYWSVDNVGNAETPKRATIQVETSGKPLTIMSGAPEGWARTPVTFALSATSLTSAITGTFYGSTAAQRPPTPGRSRSPVMGRRSSLSTPRMRPVSARQIESPR